MSVVDVRADRVRELRAQNYTYRRIGELLGISEQWAWLLVHPEALRRVDERARAWSRSGTCPECGGPMTNPRMGIYQGRGPIERCVSCYRAKEAREAFARRVVGETLDCRSCHTRKPFADFPQGLLTRYLQRQQGKPPECRSCGNAARKAYRDRRRVPCTACGKLRHHHDEAGALKGNRFSGLCYSCFHASRKATAA